MVFNATKETRFDFDAEAFLTHVSSLALISTWAGLTVFFALAYWALSFYPGHGPQPIASTDTLFIFLENLYFSIIVGTTTGLGDIVPHGFSRLITAIQTITSFILLAAFVAKFAARKQEKVLDDIHQLSFDSSFHAIRNGLFIARKDIDTVMEKAISNADISVKDWSNLRTAIRQMQIFTKHIPDFYRKRTKTHEFDVDREMLLIDALERTLTRLVETIDLLKDKNIELHSKERFVRELTSLILQIENMSLHEEQKTLDPENHDAFQGILISAQSVRIHLEGLS